MEHFVRSRPQPEGCADRVVDSRSQTGDCAGYGVGSRSLLEGCADRTVRARAFALCLAIIVTVVCKLYVTPAGFLAAAMYVQGPSYITREIRLKIGAITRRGFMHGMNAASAGTAYGATWIFGETGWSGDVMGFREEYTSEIYYNLLMAHDGMFVIPKELLIGQAYVEHLVDDPDPRCGCFTKLYSVPGGAPRLPLT